jgi:hypothetical protein
MASGNGEGNGGEPGREAEKSAEHLAALVDTIGDGMLVAGLKGARKAALLLVGGITAQAQRIDALEMRVKRLEGTIVTLIKRELGGNGGGK